MRKWLVVAVLGLMTLSVAAPVVTAGGPPTSGGPPITTMECTGTPQNPC